MLAQYVREKKTLSLMDAVRKMTLMPAQMLERSTPAARRKGRLQEGADADIVVFDPATISDRSTFEKPMETSTGVHQLLVGGTLLIDDGKLVRMCIRDGRLWDRGRVGLRVIIKRCRDKNRRGRTAEAAVLTWSVVSHMVRG